MGYSRNINAVKKVEPYLDTLLKSTGIVSWEAKDVIRFKYYLAQGISTAVYLAEQGVEELAKYKSLKYKYRLKSSGNKVIAEPIVYDAMGEEATETANSMSSNAVDLNGALIDISKYETFDAWEFTYFIPNERELQLLEKFCKNKHYELENKNEFGIVIKKQG